MGQDDTWELLDEPNEVNAAPQIDMRLTRRQKLLRTAGASLAVLVALTVIASQFGYLDFTVQLPLAGVMSIPTSLDGVYDVRLSKRR